MHNLKFVIIIFLISIINISSVEAKNYVDDYQYTLEIPEVFTDWSSFSEWIEYNVTMGPLMPFFGTESKGKLTSSRNASIKIYESPEKPCNEASIAGSYDSMDDNYTHEIQNVGEIAIWAQHPLGHFYMEEDPRYCTNRELDNCVTFPDGTGSPPDYSACDTITQATYSFCSEQGDKRIAICINQQTDDPQMAKEVFRSFRWLDESDIFTDVPITHQNATAIAYVKDHNIVQGYPSTSSGHTVFKPKATINRAEFTKILISTSSDGSTPLTMTDECATTSSFTDVEPNSWYESYVQIAQCNNIISGYLDGTFKPSNTINAAEAAKIIVNAFNLPLATVEANSPWYQVYIQTLQSHQAMPESVTVPSHEITRGEMAEIIFRVMTW